MCLFCGCDPVDGDYVTSSSEQRLAGAVAVPDEGGAAVAGPYGSEAGGVPVQAQPGRLPDGRPASVDAGGTEQAPWGWGLTPARERSDGDGDEGLEGALTALPQNPHGYSRRQQKSVERDLRPGLGNYVDYEAVPVAGEVLPPGMSGHLPGLGDDGRL